MNGGPQLPEHDPEVPCAFRALLNPAGPDAIALHALGKYPAAAAASALAQKYESTLVARAALVGVAVTKIESDAGRPQWVASRWALCRSFDSLDELGRWLDRVSGTSV